MYLCGGELVPEDLIEVARLPEVWGTSAGFKQVAKVLVRKVDPIEVPARVIKILVTSTWYWITRGPDRSLGYQCGV